MSTERRRLADRYELEDRIGRGGMGEVWRATDTVLHRQVAVKTIDLRTVPDESGHARFEREARVTAGMSHPNIVTVHDSGVEDDTAYLVMELLPGPSLAERLREGPLPVDEVEQIGLQVATALDAAHARGLVHRDIKPGNIVHAADGRVRVLDFGITQLGETTGSQALTATHTVMGTAEYLAPEQALGGRVDGRADLYALGCVLYALLAGRPPFQGPSPVATMMMHANDPVPDVRQARPDTPPWGAGRGAGARPAPPPPPPARPPPPTHRPPDRRGSSAPLWVLAAVAVLALALLGWWAWSSRSEPTATPTVTTTTATTAAPTTQAPATSAPAPSTASPTPTEDPAQAVTDALAAFSAEVGALEQDGTLDKDVAKDLDAGVRDLEKALRDGDAAAVSGAMDALTQRYDEGVQDGTVTPDAADRLDPLLADLQGAVDGYTG